ncbi:hypothetical protein Micbo1qcDRAFT_161711 [Microdochium bolleyi]|uniref:Uncharacterized protein n=1 Tax=Microdochium bolleyi TaxID=196109 RepID=A0A136J3P3_9PEZI|nr:hypothetical protein Micbo1qcDRAFT_161711 [Microdochium bolleyi]
MAPLVSAVTSRILSARDQITHISKRSSQEYETWQIVLLTLLPSLVAVGLAIYCLHQRIRLRRLYEEKKKTHPLLREREFAKLSKLTVEKRLDNEELERSIMIQKSLASRSSLVSTSFGGGFPSPRDGQSSPGFEGLTIRTDGETVRHSFAAGDSERPRTAGSRGVGAVPPSPLSQVMAFPFPESEQEQSSTSLLAPPLASPRSPNQRFSMSDSPRRPALRAVGSQENSPPGSRRSSLPVRPSPTLASQPRPPSCVY